MCSELTPSASSRPRSLRWLWRLALVVGLSWGGSGVVTGCLVSQAELECRPCPPNGSCGASFACVNKVCRPLNATPDEFVTCERPPGDGGAQE